jgi:dethiobiotin synthetase
MNNVGQRGLFITGTDTGVGKTHIAATLAHLLNGQGFIVRPRKPVESGCLRGQHGLIPSDAVTLRAAAKTDELLAQICPYRFESALSPEKAAALADKSLVLDEITDVCRQGVAESDFLLVEGAGGFYSPLASGVLNADLATALSLPVLLVTPDRLGAINQTLLAVEAIKHRGLALAAVILNQVTADIDPQMNNSEEISRWLGEKVLATHFDKTDSAVPAWLVPSPVLSNWIDHLVAGL